MVGLVVIRWDGDRLESLVLRPADKPQLDQAEQEGRTVDSRITGGRAQLLAWVFICSVVTDDSGKHLSLRMASPQPALHSIRSGRLAATSKLGTKAASAWASAKDGRAPSSLWIMEWVSVNWRKTCCSIGNRWVKWKG